MFFTTEMLIFFAKLMFWSSSDGDNEINRTPEAVPGILKSWLQKLDESSELFTFKVRKSFESFTPTPKADLTL